MVGSTRAMELFPSSFTSLTLGCSSSKWKEPRDLHRTAWASTWRSRAPRRQRRARRLRTRSSCRRWTCTLRTSCSCAAWSRLCAGSWRTSLLEVVECSDCLLCQAWCWMSVRSRTSYFRNNSCQQWTLPITRNRIVKYLISS